MKRTCGANKNFAADFSNLTQGFRASGLQRPDFAQVVQSSNKEILTQSIRRTQRLAYDASVFSVVLVCGIYTPISKYASLVGKKRPRTALYINFWQPE
jgi:hypothetical protein